MFLDANNYVANTSINLEREGELGREDGLLAHTLRLSYKTRRVIYNFIKISFIARRVIYNLANFISQNWSNIYCNAQKLFSYYQFDSTEY